jgi:hypothetical protein
MDSVFLLSLFFLLIYYGGPIFSFPKSTTAVTIDSCSGVRVRSLHIQNALVGRVRPYRTSSVTPQFYFQMAHICMCSSTTLYF